MLVKASILATAIMVVGATLTSVDFRELYNEMYPVNGLKRDVLGVCHQAKPTFVRAIKADRENCYDSMPDSVEMAIGWVRTSSVLAELTNTPTAVELAERLLNEQMRNGRLGVRPQYTGYVVTPVAVPAPCPRPANGLVPLAPSANSKLGVSDDRLTRRLGSNDEAAMAALGLAPHGAKPIIKPNGKRVPELPALPLTGSSSTDSLTGGVVPAADTAGCRTPA